MGCEWSKITSFSQKFQKEKSFPLQIPFNTWRFMTIKIPKKEVRDLFESGLFFTLLNKPRFQWRKLKTQQNFRERKIIIIRKKKKNISCKDLKTILPNTGRYFQMICTGNVFRTRLIDCLGSGVRRTLESLPTEL